MLWKMAKNVGWGRVASQQYALNWLNTLSMTHETLTGHHHSNCWPEAFIPPHMNFSVSWLGHPSNMQLTSSRVSDKRSRSLWLGSVKREPAVGCGTPSPGPLAGGAGTTKPFMEALA